MSDTTIVIPDRDRKIIFQDKFTEEERISINKKLSELSELISKDPKNISAWIDLGSYRKQGGDYEGARQAWNYVSQIYPMNFISFGNLGDLYGYYLKNPALAEKNFLKAIENGPTQVYLYFQTAEFYRDIMKDKAKALAIAKRGLSKNPGNADLQKLVDSLQ